MQSKQYSSNAIKGLLYSVEPQRENCRMTRGSTILCLLCSSMTILCGCPFTLLVTGILGPVCGPFGMQVLHMPRKRAFRYTSIDFLCVLCCRVLQSGTSDKTIVKRCRACHVSSSIPMLFSSLERFSFCLTLRTSEVQRIDFCNALSMSPVDHCMTKQARYSVILLHR